MAYNTLSTVQRLSSRSHFRRMYISRDWLHAAVQGPGWSSCCFSLRCCFAVCLLAVYRHFDTSLRSSLLPFHYFSPAVQSLSGTSVYCTFDIHCRVLSPEGRSEGPLLLLRFTIAISFSMHMFRYVQQS